MKKFEERALKILGLAVVAIIVFFICAGWHKNRVESAVEKERQTQQTIQYQDRILEIKNGPFEKVVLKEGDTIFGLLRDVGWSEREICSLDLVSLVRSDKENRKVFKNNRFERAGDKIFVPIHVKEVVRIEN